MTKTKKHRQKQFRRKMAQKRITRKRNNRKLNTRKLNIRKIGKKNKSKRLMKNYKGGDGDHDERYRHIYESIKGLKEKKLLGSRVPENIDESLKYLFSDLLPKSWDELSTTKSNTLTKEKYNLSDDEKYFKVIKILNTIIDDEKMQQAIFDKNLFNVVNLNYDELFSIYDRIIYSTEKDGFMYILLIYDTDTIYKIKLPEQVAVAEPVAEPVAVAVAQELKKPLTPLKILQQLLVFIQMRREFFDNFTEDEEETIKSASKMRKDESMSKPMIQTMEQKNTEYIYKLLDIISKRLNNTKLYIDIFKSRSYDKIKLTNWKREYDNIFLPIIEGKNNRGSSVRVDIMLVFNIIGGIICLDIMNRIYILYYEDMHKNNISLNFIDNNKKILGMNEDGIVYKNTLNNSFYLFDGNRYIKFFNDKVREVRYILVNKKIYKEDYEGPEKPGNRTFMGFQGNRPIKNLSEYKINIKSMVEYTDNISDVYKNDVDDNLMLDNTLRFTINRSYVYLKPIMQFNISSSDFDLYDYGFYIYNKPLQVKPCVILREKAHPTKYGIIKFESPISENNYEYNHDNIKSLRTIKLLYSDIAVINGNELIYKTYNKDRNSVGLFILPLGSYETTSMMGTKTTYIKIQLEIVCNGVLIYKYTIYFYNNRTSEYESKTLSTFMLLTFNEINKKLKKKLPENIAIIGPDIQIIQTNLQTLIDNFNNEFTKYMKPSSEAEVAAQAEAEPVAAQAEAEPVEPVVEPVAVAEAEEGEVVAAEVEAAEPVAEPVAVQAGPAGPAEPVAEVEALIQANILQRKQRAKQANILQRKQRAMQPVAEVEAAEVDALIQANKLEREQRLRQAKANAMRIPPNPSESGSSSMSRETVGFLNDWQSLIKS